MYELINPKTGKLTDKASLEIAQRMKLETENKIFFERLKAERLRYAEETGDISDYEDNNIKYYYKKGYTQTRIDTKRLKEEKPNIFKKYNKEVNVKPTFVLELKDDN